MRLIFVYTAIFCGVLALFGTGLLDTFAVHGNADFAKAFRVSAGALVAILMAKAPFESLVQILQAHMRGRGETATVFRIQFATSVGFWIPLFLATRAFYPGMTAYWITMLVSSLVAAAALFVCSSQRKTIRL